MVLRTELSQRLGESHPQEAPHLEALTNAGDLLDDRNFELGKHLLCSDTAGQQELRAPKRAHRDDNVVRGEDVPALRSRALLLTNFNTNALRWVARGEKQAGDGGEGENGEVLARVDRRGR